MVESPFSKVTGEISTFRKLYPVDWLLPKITSGLQVAMLLKLTSNQICYKSFENFEKYPGRCL